MYELFFNIILQVDGDNDKEGHLFTGRIFPVCNNINVIHDREYY